MEQRYLWRFYWDCGRMGDVESLFVATDSQIKEALGKHVYFGEILGKHSEIYGDFEECDVEKIDLDPDTVGTVTAILGETWSGYNPLKHIQNIYICEVCEDKFFEEEMDDCSDMNICLSCKEDQQTDFEEEL